MHDLIDRKAAIDILDAYQVMLENGEENPYSWARFRMSELPSAQPEKCEECGNFNKARLLIPQPERTDCTECAEYDHKMKSCPYYCEVIRKTADELQVEASCKLPERKTGRWIKTARWGRVYYCDQCRNYLDFGGVNAGRGSANFCPNCGADMREGK